MITFLLTFACKCSFLVKSHHVMMTFLVFDLDVFLFPVIIDRDSISVYFVFVRLILYYRPRYYLGLFCFCYCYTLLFIIDRDTISVYFVFVTVILYYYLFIIPSNRDPLPHCISKTNNNITIKFLVHTQQCLTTCRPKNSVTFTDDLDP